MWRIYILALISFLIGSSQFITSGFLDQIAAAMRISIATAGQFTTAYALVYAIVTPIVTSLTAKIDRKKIILCSFGVFILGNILSYFSSSVGVFTISRIIVASGAGISVVIALTIASQIAPIGKKASSIAIVTIGFTIALIIGVPIGRLLSSTFGWRSVFLIISLLSIIAVFIIIVFIPKVQNDQNTSIKEQLKLFKNPRVIMGLMITLFWLSGYALVYVYISPFLTKGLKLSANLVVLALFVFGIACLVGSKIGGYCADRYGVINTLLVSMVCDIVSLSFLTISINSAIYIFIFLFFWSATVWSVQPAQLANLASLIPSQTSMILGLNQSVSQMSMAIGSVLGGVIISFSPMTSLAWLGNIGVLGSIICVLFLKRKLVTDKF
ncbi:MFS transporter [Liquorilactobacillus satsumensis]|uniref:MFS transporter n=3 Tax=Liquorilactobacillus satsumensis TaxID=259059 RepID=UPI001E2CE035|nr:MFS transporter [Liquorilactobacillus satsumensis]MCC7666223.1 MFS transporter [Liquorilactobacillus satsumensis]MCP9358102.1 MFS transporter [Liquorilactobacillus satsumensis]MCP9371995.1 MFS transporter [Liquorilactobacillus satsumensis]